MFREEEIASPSVKSSIENGENPGGVPNIIIIVAAAVGGCLLCVCAVIGAIYVMSSSPIQVIAVVVKRRKNKKEKPETPYRETSARQSIELAVSNEGNAYRELPKLPMVAIGDKSHASKGDEWEIDPEELEFGEQIGKGGFF